MKVCKQGAWRRGLVGWLLATLCACAAAVTEDPAKDPLAAQAEDAMWHGDIATMEQLYSQALANPAINPWNGRSALMSVRAGFVAVFDYSRLNHAYFQELERLTRHWTVTRPQSVLAHLLHAKALDRRAWHIRGEGYASTVLAPAMEQFKALNDQAIAHLREHGGLLKDDPTAYFYLMEMARPAGWSVQAILTIAQAALKLPGTDAYWIHHSATSAMLPKWGGDWDQLVDYIDQQDKQLAGADGHELYARLWSKTASEVEGNVMADKRVDWPRIKQGYLRLSDRFGSPFYRQRLALLACLAQDRETTRAALLRSRGTTPDVQAWRGAGAGADQNRETCERWAAEGH